MSNELSRTTQAARSGWWSLLSESDKLEDELNAANERVKKLEEAHSRASTWLTEERLRAEKAESDLALAIGLADDLAVEKARVLAELAKLSAENAELRKEREQLSRERDCFERVAKFARHSSGCDSTDFECCTCGLKKAVDAVRAAMQSEQPKGEQP